ncbi:AsmA-like C-terminal region-containing protein [Polaromonas sp. CG_9.11]|uniref:AsmA-like C-terminal region-containing protein n=1 Tax=Polaromonas sp. CG_9.11 TaxID=2787730 RepID=UPI0018CA3FF2|nr:AsmA-like C-terminal region-containing protein [Polaromonas sp. CG_9.11]MBG6075540.1 uncharacterized protein involved in outer membrane biogenesis [Polaromonas sp. CG_9.11]
MMRTRKWLLGAGLVLGALGLLAIVLVRLVPSDEELRLRATAELEAALGVPVSVGALHWQLLPSPRVVIENVATTQTQPVEVKKLTAYLNTAALWRRRLKLDSAELEGAVLPQLSLHDLGNQQPLEVTQKPEKREEAPKTGPLPFDELPLVQFAFRDVTWISRTGVRIGFDGEADFDAGWRPRSARIRRPEITPPADLALTRQGQEDRWEARINLGGGTAHGELQLQPRDKGGLRLSGKFKPQGIEVDSALRAINQPPIVAGKASGDTTVSASGDTAGALARSLHTTTSFTMGRSTLLRFDLDKAIRSLGKAHAGKTPLDAITGQLDTQNTAQGMVVSLTRLTTSSGVLSASGQARIASRKIDAEFSVDLVDGVVGVPLRLSGPLDKVQVSVPASALAGAAAGSVVLPGVGTAIGARIGAAIGRMLGAEPAGGPRRLAPVEK